MKTRPISALLVGLLLMASPAVYAGEPAAVAGGDSGAVEWLKFDAALQAASAGDKHIMVDVYTDWCGWCKKLDRETYADPAVKQVLAESYISSKVKGDSDGPLNVKSQPKVEDGKTLIQFVPSDQAQITEKQLARAQFRVTGYPTILFFAADGRMITKLSGYQNAETFKNILNFIKDDLYEVMSYQDYLKSLQNADAGGKS